VQLFNTGAGLTFLLVFDFEPGGRSARMLCGLFTAATAFLEPHGETKIVEIAFWFVAVAIIRKIGTMYFKSGDVLYGSYVTR
jgi:hypothetical protein